MRNNSNIFNNKPWYIEDDTVEVEKNNDFNVAPIEDIKHINSNLGVRINEKNTKCHNCGHIGHTVTECLDKPHKHKAANIAVDFAYPEANRKRLIDRKFDNMCNTKKLNYLGNSTVTLSHSLLNKDETKNITIRERDDVATYLKLDEDQYDPKTRIVFKTTENDLNKNNTEIDITEPKIFANYATLSELYKSKSDVVTFINSVNKTEEQIKIGVKDNDSNSNCKSKNKSKKSKTETKSDLIKSKLGYNNKLIELFKSSNIDI